MIPFTGSDSASGFRTLIGFLGKFSNSIGWGVVYLYTSELFPTTLRQIGVGSSSVAARVGSIIAPFVKELSQVTHLWVTMCVFGILSTVASGLICFLPETRGKEIPDTIQERKRQDMETKGM
jgi:hypothetical protein